MLLYAFLPFWFVPGLLDYGYHRTSKIETTAGTRESLTHAIEFAIVGLPVTLALLFEIDAFILAVAALAAITHEGVSLYDVSYATDRRRVVTGEQHVHSFLEVMPIAGAFMLIGSYPEAAKRLLRDPRSALRPSLKWKKQPVPRGYLAAFFSAVFGFIVVPYSEEFVRCYRADPSLRETPRTLPNPASE